MKDDPPNAQDPEGLSWKALAAWHCSHLQQIHSHLVTLQDGSQGDFIEALMDSVGSELSKPARELSEFSLNSCLDSALRASSAQYDAPDQINRLRIKLEASQPNDDGVPSCTLTWLHSHLRT